MKRKKPLPRKRSLTEQQVKEIRYLIKQGLSNNAIGKFYNANSNTVNNIRKGKGYAWVKGSCRTPEDWLFGPPKPEKKVKSILKDIDELAAFTQTVIETPATSQINWEAFTEKVVELCDVEEKQQDYKELYSKAILALKLSVIERLGKDFTEWNLNPTEEYFQNPKFFIEVEEEVERLMK